MDNIVRFFQTNKIAQVALVIVIVMVLMNLLKPSMEKLEIVASGVTLENPIVLAEEATVSTQISPDQPVAMITGNGGQECKYNQFAVKGYEDKSLDPTDLLPKSQVAAQFESQFPSGGPVDSATKNFLTAGFNVGINTISSSLRNANTQLRSDPYIPMNEDISPWNISTITADTNRLPLNIGTTC
ncbi:MAG: hypothetical protein EHM20_13215 [Alphaproteobacteria bacterium]|nr:MAG: hypothetical protein EHM20_14315 [Alphaproteobacteria bacterium]RPJ72840.1 MAG: hypothetical protein EHM20_13215 [Alphaproteobacteria bacterium]